MKEDESEYIELLEKTLILAQQRGDFLQKVIGSYGSHKADDYLKSIRILEVSINENTSKIQALKEGKKAEN